MISAFRTFFLVFTAMLLVPPAGLAAPPNLERILAKTILEPGLSTVEVQVYTGTRVPSMPLIHTAGQWRREAERLRRRVLDEVVLRGEARRWRDAKTRVEWLETIETARGYRIRKLRFEAVPGMWIPALLYEPTKLTGKVPVVLNVNGHGKDGIALPYIQERCINLAKHGLISLNPEWLGAGQSAMRGLDHGRLNQLDLLGTSGVSVFYLSLVRSLDVLLAHEHADTHRVAVTGLSGGGWQAILLSSLDPRVSLTNPVAGYSGYVTRTQFPALDLGDSEQTPSDLAAVLDYTHLTAMMAPRPTLLTYNANDKCCFRAGNSMVPLVHAAQPIFKLLEAGDKLRYHVSFENGHNYGQDNREAFYRMLRDYFYGGSKDFPVAEIPSADEVSTAEALHVSIPADNQDFHSLAVQLSRALPRAGSPGRARLCEIVRAHQCEVSAKRVENENDDGLEITRWRLRMGDDWTVPAVELSRANANSTVIVVSDGGRSSAAPQALQFLSEGKRVIAIDPFYFGESTMGDRGYLFALLVASVGERALGIQASQVAATARWLRTERRLGPVTVVSVGPRSSVFSLVAAVLEPEAIAAIERRQAMSSLRDIIDRDLTADQTPELFCFGLLEEFDLPQVVALVAPRPVRMTP